jgi:hypothetical protein
VGLLLTLCFPKWRPHKCPASVTCWWNRGRKLLEISADAVKKPCRLAVAAWSKSRADAQARQMRKHVISQRRRAYQFSTADDVESGKSCGNTNSGVLVARSGGADKRRQRGRRHRDQEDKAGPSKAPPKPEGLVLAVSRSRKDALSPEHVLPQDDDTKHEDGHHHRAARLQSESDARGPGNEEAEDMAYTDRVLRGVDWVKASSVPMSPTQSKPRAFVRSPTKRMPRSTATSRSALRVAV